MVQLSKIVLVFVFLKIISTSVYSKNKVLIIDTGYNRFKKFKKLCKNGHRNFTSDHNMYDADGHGSNIINLISKSKKDFCIVVYKAFSRDSLNGDYKASIIDASFKNFTVVNLSISGGGFNIIERNAIERMLKKGTHVVVAAGNDAIKLNKGCNIYPACLYYLFKKYKNFHVVGASDLKQTNHGPAITNWDVGSKQGVPKMSGTSQATANYTKKLLDSLP